ncbi:MAG: nucleoside triphosphate pyrophosphohydrolase [Pseudomonadales bacterium]|nr:nucleoside triphosphate pyrophosphohydrolase [Pseudomonadales bacterium]
MNSNKPIDKLLYIIERLRDPETGCPWDVKQTYETIAPYTIEEAYEVVDAIEKKDHQHLGEEVGDLLLQVMLYAQIGKEASHFDFDEIVQMLNQKLLRRHPHVFPDGSAESRIKPGTVVTEEQVAENWNKVKAQEKLSEKAKTNEKDSDVPSHILDDVPTAMAPMLRALKLQKKAAQFGFDWSDLKPVLAKVNEEVAELNEAIEEEHSRDAVMGEIGDVLFCCINLCRHMKIDAEDALRSTNNKFVRRLNRVEDILTSDDEKIGDVNLERLDECWDQVKEEERRGS